MNHILAAGIASSIAASANAQFRLSGDVSDWNMPDDAANLKTPHVSTVMIKNAGSVALRQPGNILSYSESSRIHKTTDRIIPYNYRFELENWYKRVASPELIVHEELLSSHDANLYLFPENVATKFSVSISTNPAAPTPKEATSYHLYFIIYDSVCSLQYGNSLADKRCIVYDLPIIATPRYWRAEHGARALSAAPPEKRYPMIKNRPMGMDPPPNLPNPAFPPCYSDACDVP